MNVRPRVVQTRMGGGGPISRQSHVRILPLPQPVSSVRFTPLPPAGGTPHRDVRAAFGRPEYPAAVPLPSPSRHPCCLSRTSKSLTANRTVHRCRYWIFDGWKLPPESRL